MLSNGHIKFKKDLPGPARIDLEYDFDSSKLSRIDCGGKVFCLAVPEDPEALMFLLENCMKYRIGFHILGGCTNTLLSDRFHNEVFIKIGKGFQNLEAMENGEIKVGAAHDMQRLIVRCARLGMDSSFMAGIPGTLGGAVKCNSGPKGSPIGSYVVKIGLIKATGDKIIAKEIDREGLRFSYRKLELPDDEIINYVFLRFPKGEDNILASLRERIKDKKIKQPLNTKNLGCFFKNPKKDLSAGKLIEQAGLKGLRYGGAAVSSLHANYIENVSNASFSDITGLASIIKANILKNNNIKLELEVRIIE